MSESWSVVWLWIKWVLGVLWTHIGLLLWYDFLALLLGVFLMLWAWKLLRSKEVIKRPDGIKRWYKIWLRLSLLLCLMSVLSLSLIVGTHLAAQKAVELEVKRGVDGVSELIAQRYFGGEEGRARMEYAYDVVVGSGELVNIANEQMAKGLAREFSNQKGSSKLLSFFEGMVLTKSLEAAIVAAEKEVVYILINVGLSYVKADDLMSYERFEAAFDKWLKEDVHKQLPDVQDFLFELIWKYIKPAVFGVFIPFYLIALFFIVLPFLDRWIFRSLDRKRKSKLNS